MFIEISFSTKNFKGEDVIKQILLPINRITKIEKYSQESKVFFINEENKNDSLLTKESYEQIKTSIGFYKNGQ